MVIKNTRCQIPPKENDIIMNLRHFTLCSVAAALVGCNAGDENKNNNNIGSVVLSGSAVVGQTLQVSVSDPDGISSNVSYYWYADDQLIEGENGESLLITQQQIGMQLSAQAKYIDNGGVNESHITDKTANVAALAYPSLVTISGDAFIGSTLMATVTDDNGFDPETVIFEWQADGVVIENELLSSLLLTEQQFGKVITVRANFEDNQGFDETAISAPTQAVQRVNEQGVVSIVGAPTVGNVLSAEVTDADGISGEISYQWFLNSEVITEATQPSITVNQSHLGKSFTVQVMYTDDHGFSEDNLSEATIEVSEVAVDQAGSIAIIGTAPYLADVTLSAEIADNNGIDEANVSYSWYHDGEVIADATAKTFTPTDYAGAIISVSATYTDNDGFAGQVSTALDSIVYSQVVSDKAALSAALNAPVDGSVIGLNSGIYADLAEILLTSEVTIRAVEQQTPVISGDVCIHVASDVDGLQLSGLTFKDLDTLAGSYCDSQEQAVIYSEADNFVFSHNVMDGDQTDLNNETYHWLVVKGNNALIERNTFANRNNAEKGAVVKLASSSTNHIIQYNLFNNSAANASLDSSLMVINVGSSTGEDAAQLSNFKVQYNRIDDFVTGRRVMRVQTSGASINGNTIINPNGAISLEDGGFNTVSNNVIIRKSDIAQSNDRPSGVLITPLGHSVTNNYIAGIRADGKETGGIVFTANPFSQASGGVPNAGNQAVLDSAGDFTLDVSNNTVLNSIQPIVFSTEIGSKAPVGDCDELTADNAPVLYGLTKNFFKITFDGNLIANGLNDNQETQGLFLPFDASSSDHSFEYDCDLINHTQSVFSNSFGFSDSYASGDAEDDYWVDIRKLNGNGDFDADGAIDQDPAANSKEVPEFVTADNGLLETDVSGAQALAGAKGLYLIKEEDVGAGSTWQAEQQ